jgi:RNA polymerase sigma-B factor
MRVPRRYQELVMAVNDANAALAGTLGRSPTVTDVAGHLDLSKDDVLDGLHATRVFTATSLSTPITAGSSTVLGDTLGRPDHNLELAELRAAALRVPLPHRAETQILAFASTGI